MRFHEQALPFDGRKLLYGQDATDREGAVLYFADGWMVKVKSDHYRLVKSLRPLLQRVILRGRSLNKTGETADLARAVIDYARDHSMGLTYERQAFGERDVDMTKVGEILKRLGRGYGGV